MTKLIPILSGRSLVVELPEGAPIPDVINTGRPHLSWLDIDIDLTEIDLPPGTWQIVGMLPEVTESDADVMVLGSRKLKPFGFTASYETLYRDYAARPSYDRFRSAIESLESSILAEGYYLDVNPIPVPDYSEGHVRFDETVEHAKAQSRALTRERCLLLRRVE